jgi:hypothetical protein
MFFQLIVASVFTTTAGELIHPFRTPLPLAPNGKTVDERSGDESRSKELATRPDGRKENGRGRIG